MKNFKYIIFFIVCFIKGCQCDKKQADKSFLRKERTSLWRMKERIINGLSRMYKYDVNGWVDVQNIRSDSLKQIDLTLQDGKVICKNSNNVVPVKALSYKIVHEDKKHIYSEYIFEYVGVNSKKKMLNPIPVMIPKESKRQIINQNKVLPENFQGYLVCEEKGSPASLIQHTIETLEFTTPPWRTLVNIELYRNPLAPYGRLYKIIVLDNVEVLKNGKKSFFWPLPVSSMADVYAFQTAIDDSRKGRYCMLSRDDVSFNIKLSCRSWERSITNAAVNGFLFLGLLIMNSCMGSNLFFMKHPPLYTKTFALADGNATVIYEKEEILRLAEEEDRSEESTEVADEGHVDLEDESTDDVAHVKAEQGEEDAKDYTVKAAGPSTGSSKGGKGGHDKSKKDKKVEKKSKGELALETFDKYYPYKEDDKKKMQRMLFYGNLIYLIGWGLLNGGWGIVHLVKIGSVLKRADNELKEAKRSNPWKLEYQQV